MNKLSKVKNIIVNGPQKLDCGKEISNFPIAYETYGNLNDRKDNAILCLLYTSPSPRDKRQSRMPSSA